MTEKYFPVQKKAEAKDVYCYGSLLPVISDFTHLKNILCDIFRGNLTEECTYRKENGDL